MRTRIGAILGCVALGVSLAGCGNSGDDEASTSTLQALTSSTAFSTIPTTSTTLSPVASTNPDGSTNASGEDLYEVQSGDYPLKIANLYGCTWEEIAAYNDRAPGDGLFPGDQIKIPFTCTLEGQTTESTAPPGETPTTAGATTTTRAADGSGSYTVEAGDTMSGIASKFDTTMDAIVAINGFSGINHPLFPGDVIKVPVAG